MRRHAIRPCMNDCTTDTTRQERWHSIFTFLTCVLHSPPGIPLAIVSFVLFPFCSFFTVSSVYDNFNTYFTPTIIPSVSHKVVVVVSWAQPSIFAVVRNWYSYRMNRTSSCLSWFAHILVHDETYGDPRGRR